MKICFRQHVMKIHCFCRQLMKTQSFCRQMLTHLESSLQCRELPDPLRSRHNHPLHVPCTYHCPQTNLTLTFRPHAYPFFSGRHWSDPRVKHSVGFVLDTLPAAGRHVVLTHLYMHLARVHSNILGAHVREAARAVARLLRRQPGAQVFVRGPHAMGANVYTLTGDYHAERSFRMLRKEFKDLQDRVVLLNPWDMTMANENFHIHPSPEVQAILCRMMLSHLC